MSNSKVKMVVEFDIDPAMLDEFGLKAEDVLKGVVLRNSDIIDGFELSTEVPGFDATTDFFLRNGKVVSKELVSPARKLDVERYPNLTNTRDGKYIKGALNPQGLQIIENILQAYSEDKIDIEVVRDENEQIEFDKSGGLIVKDKSYEEIGFESLVIKWYEDMEDTGYLVECFDEFARDKELDRAVHLVDEVCAQPKGYEVFWKASVLGMLKVHDILSNDELLIMTDRIYEAQYCSPAPLLTAARADAAIFLLEYGITEKRFPDWPVMTPEQTKEFLLTCDYDVFLDFIDTVTVDDQNYYMPDYIGIEREEALNDALVSFASKKPTLDNAISKADLQKTDVSVSENTKDLER